MTPAPLELRPPLTDAEIAEVRVEVDRYAKQLVAVAFMAIWAGAA